MKLVSCKNMLNKAKAGHYAVGHFNLNNMESIRAAPPSIWGATAPSPTRSRALWTF